LLRRSNSGKFSGLILSAIYSGSFAGLFVPENSSVPGRAGEGQLDGNPRSGRVFLLISPGHAQIATDACDLIQGLIRRSVI